jgi:hypothetical protein
MSSVGATYTTKSINTCMSDLFQMLPSFRVTSILLIMFLTACTHAVPAIQATSLTALPDISNTKPIVQQVVKGSPAASKVNVGDIVIAVDKKPVSTTEEVWEYFAGNKPFPEEVQFQKKGGDVYVLTVSEVFDADAGNPYVNLFQYKKTYVLPKKQSKFARDIALQNNREALIISSADYWPSYTGFIELRTILHMGDKCKKCKFESIEVSDKIKKVPLKLASPQNVAVAVYPYLGSPGTRVAVPAPTISGYNAISNTYGNTYGNIYSSPYSSYSNFSGSYSANTYTNVTPVYDHSAQNAALAHNLGVKLQEERIVNQNQARAAFIASRQSDLSIGKLEPGAIRNSALFYTVPPSSSGKYRVKYMISGKQMQFEFELKK